MCFLVSPPAVTVVPNNATAKVFENITFICHTTGFGEFSFVWEHNGSVILSSNSTLRHSYFSIQSILPQNQGQYKCTVASFYSNLSSSAFATLNLNGNFWYLAVYSICTFMYCVSSTIS